MKWLTDLLAAPAVRQAALALVAALLGAALGPQLVAPLPVVQPLDAQVLLGPSASF